MTKLYADILINYFHELSRSKFRSSGSSDYIFPEQYTAEFIAEKFGVTTNTVLRKLKELEEENIIVSMRRNVVGKPGKRLVFFLNDGTISDMKEKPGKQKTPITPLRSRDLLYEVYHRKSELEENGDTLLTLFLTIKNISTKEIEEIPLPKFKFDTYDNPNLFDKLIHVEVNGNIIPYSSEGLHIHKQSWSGSISPTDKSTTSKFYSQVHYVIPLDNKLMPGKKVSIKLVTLFPMSHRELYDYEFIGMLIDEFTMNASLEIVPPKGSTIKNYKEYEGEKYTNGVIVVNHSSEKRNHDLEKAVDSPKVTARSIKWSIERPPIGYRYLIPFVVKKK